MSFMIPTSTQKINQERQWEYRYVTEEKVINGGWLYLGGGMKDDLCL